MSIHPFAFVIFCLCWTFSQPNSLPVPFKQCSTRRTGQIFKPVVSAPCKDDYCVFYKNTTAHLYFSFSIKKKAQKVRAKIVATIGSVDHDFFIPNHDACEQLHCPLKPNTHYSYYHSMFVSPTYPSVRVKEMRYYLIDGKGRELVCLSLPVMITENDSKQ